MIEVGAYYPDEHASGKFLESNFAKPHVYFTEPETPFMMAYYTPNAYFYRLHTLPLMKNEAALFWSKPRAS